MEPATETVTYAIDADGIVCAWSASAERLFGFKADHVVGRHVRALTPRVALEPSVEIETKALRVDGTWIPVALTISAARDGFDCRAREVAERRDQAVMWSDLEVRRHASDGVVTADRAGQVIEINPAAERLLGWTRAAALGRPLGIVIADPSVASRVFGGDAVHDERRDGHLLLHAQPLRDAGGAIVGATAVISDVTAAEVARERDEHAAGLLERTSRALAESLDEDEALDRAVAAFVPDLADVCIISALEPDGGLALRAAIGAEPDLDSAARVLCGSRRAPDVNLDLGSGQPFALQHVTTEHARRLVKSPSEARLAEVLGPHWQTVLPLRARNRVWGIVVLLARDARPEPDRAALRLMQELAERCGQALENARLYALATEARARFTAAFEQAPIGMALIDRDGTVTAANPALVAILGRELEGRGLPELSVHEPGERRVVTAAGDTVWVQTRVAHLDSGGEVVLLVQDISERKRYEGELQYLADHDPLTGLFNRRRFAEELDWVLAYSRRYHSPAALVAIDVDNFKFVNDTFGHATGDELLVAIAAALKERCRESDIVGRVGGDEFGIVLPQSGIQEADIVAQALLDAVRDVRVMVGQRAVRATASIGVRLIGEETRLTAEEILSDADIALYDAKESGRDRMSVAGDNRQVTDRLRARITWSDRIRDALNHEGFMLYEQPILNLAQRRIVASELLLRMRGEGDQVIAPGEFLDTAERFGQIQAIDRWVLERAVRLLAERQAAGLDLHIEVNLSGGSISDPTVIDFIAAEVRNAGIDPTALTIEVTETAAIVNIERARALAQSLADLGCRFALDDFGSGFGSFYYLKHLPFDVVKIDGEFVKDLDTSHTDRLTVQAIVQIAGGLNKPTIAEFVESEAALEILAQLGVECAQGYHIGRPRPVVTDPGFGG